MTLTSRIEDETKGGHLVTDPELQRKSILRAIELGFLQPATTQEADDGEL